MNENQAAYIVVFAIFICIALARSIFGKPKPAKKLSAKALKKNPDAVQAAEWTRDRIRELESHGYTHLLMADYSFKTRLTDKDLQSIGKLEQILNDMLREMLKYLDLPMSYRARVIYDPDMKIAPDRAGECDFKNRRIHVYLRKNDTADTIRAILSHECAHYFSHFHALEKPDKAMNERCTDITACLTGFSLYMLKPGSPGYLKPEQFQMVRAVLLEERKKPASTSSARPAQNQQASQTVRQDQANSGQKTRPIVERNNPAVAQKQLEADREKLRSLVRSARDMLAQARDLVAVKKIPSRTDLQPEDYTFLQQAIDRLNAGGYDDRLRRCEGSLNGNQEDVSGASDQAMSVCEEISRILWVYR